MMAPDEGEWSLRLAKAEDADAMPAIERAAGTMFDAIPALGEVGRDPTPVDRLRRYIARGHSLVARHHDKIIGFLVIEPFGRELHLREVSVDPEWQGRGIGAGLMRACLIDARNTGFHAVTLTTFADVPWNAPFCRRLGFVDVDPSMHGRLASELASETSLGMPPGSRVAMIHELA